MKKIIAVTCALSLLIAAPRCVAQDDVADVPSEDLRAGKDESKRYFLIGRPEKKPRKPPGLVLVMPGGSTT